MSYRKSLKEAKKHNHDRVETRCANQRRHLADLNIKVSNLQIEVKELKDLLKECANELKLFRMLSLPMASKEALDECDDFLTRVSSVIGESEE